MKRLTVLLVALLAVSAAQAGPGGRVKVFGRTMQYRAAGRGSPTVVFLSGLGNTMDDWRKVQRAVAENTATLAYNRPGYGFSTMSKRPRTGASIVEETHELLRALGVAPPYVLVGHSVGGLYANLYARTYPGEVCGVVLVDASHPDQIERFEAMRPTLARVLRAAGMLMGLFLPHDSGAAARGVGGGVTVNLETRALKTTSDQVKGAGPFPDVPLVVVTATKHRPAVFPEEEWQRLQKDLAALSPRARQVFATKSGHFVHHDEPALVIQAIRDAAPSHGVRL